MIFHIFTVHAQNWWDILSIEIRFLVFLTILSIRVHRNDGIFTSVLKSAMTIILTNVDFTKGWKFWHFIVILGDF